MVASPWDRGLFNTEDMGGKGSLTVDKGEMKKLPESTSCGSCWYGPSHSQKLFFAAFVEGGD